METYITALLIAYSILAIVYYSMICFVKSQNKRNFDKL